MDLRIKENTKENYALRKLRTYEIERLNCVEWIDKKNGQFRIPIDEAQKIVLKSYMNEKN